MYTKKIQIINYGPIDHIDIQFPFNGENPKPVLFVGENGSGKSIILSHIVNGLMAAQGIIYPENSEVDKGRVYKLRSPSYVKSGKDYSGGRLDYENSLFFSELCLTRLKQDFPVKPNKFDKFGMSDEIWTRTPKEEHTFSLLNFHEKQQDIKRLFKENCILYFPANRFEEPAWLNEENLKSKAEYMNFKLKEGYTNRKIINHAPLRDNQNWLFEILFDMRVFSHDVRGAKEIYGFVIDILEQIFPRFSFEKGKLGLNIGPRQGRQVSLMRDNQILVRNIFQLSSGETSLLDIFLSILRDFDLCQATFANLKDVRGIVVIDEIDLHLHAIHQAEILPKLMKMFPRVQFIVTTHSPLFVLGMKEIFGQDNFAIYSMPQGNQIGPEEFSEFDSAFRSFISTEKFHGHIKQAIDNAQKPIVLMEGTTDIQYLQKAATLLKRESVLEKVELQVGGSASEMGNTWSKLNKKFCEGMRQKTILLFDSDASRNHGNKGKLYKCGIPKQESHPIQKGIENLFSKTTLKKAREHKPAFIDIDGAHTKTKRGVEEPVPEEWMVNEDEKTNLCNWLCENGTAEDFEHFQEVFDMLEAILADGEPTKH